MRYKDVKVGQLVRWTSQAKTKEGRVVWTVESNVGPELFARGAPFPRGYIKVIRADSQIQVLPDWCPYRKRFDKILPTTGVIVRVVCMHKRTGAPLRPKFYGPRVGALELVKEVQDG